MTKQDAVFAFSMCLDNSRESDAILAKARSLIAANKAQKASRIRAGFDIEIGELTLRSAEMEIDNRTIRVHATSETTIVGPSGEFPVIARAKRRSRKR